MEQAIELLGLTGLLLAVVASTLAVVVSGFTIFHLIRRAIGRQIDSHTASTHAKFAETLARIDENVKNLTSQVKTLTDQVKTLTDQVNTQGEQMRQMERNLRGEIIQQVKELREEMAQQGKELREETAQQENRLGDQIREGRAVTRQVEAKIDKTAADVNWVRGVLEGLGRNPMHRIESGRQLSDSQEPGDDASP